MPPETKTSFRKRGPGLSWAASGGRGWPFVLLGYFGCHWCLAILESLKSRGGGIYTSWGFSGFFFGWWSMPDASGICQDCRRHVKRVKTGSKGSIYIYILSIVSGSNQKAADEKIPILQPHRCGVGVLEWFPGGDFCCGAEVFGVFRAVPEMFDAIGIVPWTWGTLETGEMTLKLSTPIFGGERNEFDLRNSF